MLHHFHLKHKKEEVDEDEREEILNEDIWTLFKKLAIPAIIGMLMYAIYVFVDAIFVGQWVGKEGLAAISIVFPLTLINSGIASFVGMGSASLLSRAMGARDEKTLAKILGNNLILLLVFSLGFAVLGYYFAEDMVRYLGGEGLIQVYGVDYFRIVVLGSFFINFIGSSVMLTLAEGNTKAAMTIIVSGSMFNIILDPIFIKFLDMEVEGAAIATVLAMVVTTLITLSYYLRGKSVLKFNLKGFHLDTQYVRDITPVGVSGAAMQFVTVVEFVLIYKSVGSYGNADDLALIGATLNMLNFALIPLWGISQGLQPVIGMNFGAKQYSRTVEALKKFLLAATVILLVLWTIFMLFPHVILGMYITDPDLADSGASMFRIIMAFFFLHGFIALPATYFQAIGKGGIATFLIVARQILIFAPLVLFLPTFMDLDGVWISLPIADVSIVALTSLMIGREIRSIGKE
jgi:putative MATE family efflux protein